MIWFYLFMLWISGFAMGFTVCALGEGGKP